jgi:oligosaccharide repeat unit polymerase
MVVRGSLLNYNDAQIIDNRIISYFIMYFVGPAQVVLLPLAILFTFNKTRKRFSLIVYLCVVSGIISSGGRITLLYSIAQMIAVAFYFKVNISKKAKRNIVIASIALLIAIIILTNLRTRSGLWFSIYSYFSAPVVMLSEYMRVADSMKIQTFGGATLYPFMYIANAVTDVLGMNIKYLNNLVYYVGLPQRQWIELFPGRAYNAFCSMFYFFYLDFRYVGVIVVSFIYGGVTSYVYKKSFKERSQKYLLWYLLLLQTIVASFTIWQLGNTKFFVSILILLVSGIKMKKEKPVSDPSRQKNAKKLH